MKKHIKYIASLFVAMASLTACSQQEVDVYDTNSNGIYFNKADTAALKDTVNFADSVLTQPSEIKRTVQLKLMGYMADSDRRFVVKTREVPGYPLADIKLDETTLPAGQYTVDLGYTVSRPDSIDTTYAVQLYLDAADGNSQLGEGNEGYDSYTIFVKEEYTEPSDWFYPAENYLGEFTSEKYLLLVAISGKVDFYSQSKWDCDYAKEAVDSLRAFNKANPDNPSTIALPFYYDPYAKYGYMPNEYSKPDYWTAKYDEVLGEYNTELFYSVASALGATTANENEVFPEDPSSLAPLLDKKKVTDLMTSFNNYFMSWGMAPSQFKWYNDNVQMSADVDYDVVTPVCWMEYDDYGNTNPGYSYVQKYYGDYSEEKYKFMIKVWLNQTTNTDDPVFVQFFPFYNGWDESYTTYGFNWDSSLGGEEAMQQIAAAMKAEYAKNPSAYSFTFPE